MNRPAYALIVSGLLITVESASATEPFMSAKFHDLSDTQFSITAVSPGDRIREYVICKGIWFAEAKGVRTVSFGNPVYAEPEKSRVPPQQVPEDWVQVSTTVYLENAPNPTGNPTQSVAEWARTCRQAWDWYQ